MMTKLHDQIHSAIAWHRSKRAMRLATRYERTLEEGLYQKTMPLLHLAVEFNNLKFAGMLLERGVDIHCENGGKETALYIAAWKNKRRAVEWLLERGADLRYGEGEKRTALVGAVLGNHPKLVKKFIDMGADVNAPFENRGKILTPLCFCYWDQPQEEVAALLRAHGAEFAPGFTPHIPETPTVDWRARIRSLLTGSKPKDESEPNRFELGRRALENGDYEEAVDHLTWAAAEDVPLETLRYYRGIALDMLGNYEGAIHDLSMCLEQQPDVPKPLYSRFLVYRKMERWAEAFADVRRAHEFAPDDYRIVNAYAQLLAESPVQEHRDGERAVKLATHACELTGWEDAVCVQTLSAAYREAGDESKANEYATKVEEMSRQPGNSASHDPLDMTDEIRGYFERQMEKSPNALGLQEIIPGRVGVSVWTIEREDGSLIFTTGMSQLPMSVPPDRQDNPFAEVLMRLPADWPTEPAIENTAESWPWVHLRMIAHYPHERGTYYPQSPSVFPPDCPLDEPIAPGCPFTAFLLIPNESPFDGFRSVQGPAINAITVMPIYTEEYELAKAEGGMQALFDRFDKAEISASLDRDWGR